LEVPMVEAATILRHLSLSGPGRKLESLDESARGRAVEAVRTRLTPFARELVNSLQFYQTQPDSLGIGGILITGGTSHLEGLASTLNQMIGVNVTVGDPLGRIVSHAPFNASIEAAMNSMAVPIGLAISDLAMRSVDLFPRGAAKKRSSRSSLIAVGAPIAAVVPLVALGALYFGAHGTVSSRQADLNAVQEQIAALPKPVGPTIDPALAGADAQRAVGVANVLGGRIAWEQMFRDVARVLPDNVWLDAMTATAPAGVTPADAATAASATTSAAIPAASPTDVSITGATYTQTDVARLLARLATLPSLSNVTLVSSTTQKATGKKQTVRFDIVASLSTTGGAS
jgi:Tfp pilus assembly protein PilN